MYAKPLRRAVTFVITFAFGAVVASSASAEFTILPLGDSSTDGGGSRPTYRPYLWQTIQNYLENLPSGPSALQVDFVGPRSGTATTPNGIAETPIGHAGGPFQIDPAWDDDHAGYPGDASYNALPGRSRDIDVTLAGLSKVPDLTIIQFGSNDISSGNRTNDSTPLKAVDDIATVVGRLLDHNSDMQVLIGAVPPMDSRLLSNATGHLFWWDEDSRGQTAPAGTFPDGYDDDLAYFDGSKWVSIHHHGADPGGIDLTATTNDVIDAINNELAAYAATMANVIFVDALDQHPGTPPDYRLVEGYDDPDTTEQEAGDNVDVDGGGTFDLAPDASGALDDLADGIHLSVTGDQYYAAAFWEQGVRASLNGALAAQPVPEPGAIVYLGLISIGMWLMAGWYRSQRD